MDEILSRGEEGVLLITFFLGKTMDSAKEAEEFGTARNKITLFSPKETAARIGLYLHVGSLDLLYKNELQGNYRLTP